MLLPLKMKHLIILASLLLLVACGPDSPDRDRDGNRTSMSYSDDEFSSNLELARQNCTQSNPKARKQCLISYLGCSAVTGDTTCDD